jgi:nitrile hydratase
VDGIHDLGGMHGFGPVTVHADEPVFAERWHAHVFALLFAVTSKTGAHRYRHAVERMDPAHYLAATYYERMLTGILTLAVEHGLVTVDELHAQAGGRVPLARPMAHDLAIAPEPVGRFAAGDAVLVRTFQPRGHTRCPRYARGRRGVVVRVDPSFEVPDVAAHVRPAPSEPTYAVAFAARELWGADAPADETIHVDLWERWLEPA